MAIGGMAHETHQSVIEIQQQLNSIKELLSGQVRPGQGFKSPGQPSEVNHKSDAPVSPCRHTVKPAASSSSLMQDKEVFPRGYCSTPGEVQSVICMT